jgi:glycosyltransferase involved in cell wall biosynthesis
MIIGAQNEAITKYLDRYAEVEATIELPGHHYDYSLVIPAFNEEHESVLKVWQQIEPGTSFLVILVVNSSVEEDHSASKLIDGLTNHQQMSQLTDQAQLIEKTHGATGPDLLIIDRFSRGYSIDKKRGVGLARKIGMDIAASLINQGVISSKWLFTTDADAELPENYFNVDNGSDDAAVIYPFQHVAQPGLELPMQLYEISMLYYVAGLRWANSPYAYPTIGSTISCSLDRYAAVRGFPKRNTGEDFYLLNKLRKTGTVRLADGDPIIISGRTSDRVPIGTGQAIMAIDGLDSPLSEFTLEHPNCFAQLKRFLLWLNGISVTQPGQLSTGDPNIDDYVRQIGLIAHYETKKQQSPSPKVMRKHLNDWFDGLKTRQFVHHFRDQQFGRVSIAELKSTPFMPNLKDGAYDPDAMLDTIRASLHAFIYHQNAG